MSDCVSVLVCVSGSRCPNYHSDLVQLIKNGNYQNEKIEKDRPMRMYQTRLAVVAETADIEKDPLKQAEDNLRILITRLEKDLRKEVFRRNCCDNRKNQVPH